MQLTTLHHEGERFGSGIRPRHVVHVEEEGVNLHLVFVLVLVSAWLKHRPVSRPPPSTDTSLPPSLVHPSTD